MLHGKQALKTFLFNPQIPKIPTNGQGYVPLVMVFVSRTVTNTNSRPGSGLSTCARCATSVDMNLLLLLLQEWSRWSRWLATSASCATSSTTTRWWRASRTARRRLTSTSTLYACLFSALLAVSDHYRCYTEELSRVRLIDWVVVLRPTGHKTDHFGDVSPHRSLDLVWKKLNLTQQKLALTNQKKCTHTCPFNDPFSGTTQVTRYHKGKANLDFTDAIDS